MIIENTVLCLSCGDKIVSKHRHDFVECTCGAVAVDGGQEYLRRVGDFGNAMDISWSLPDDVYNACAEAAQNALDTGRNKFGIANAVMRTLREYQCIVAEGEQRIMAQNLGEIMVVEADGAFKPYNKVIESNTDLRKKVWDETVGIKGI
jgi:predicted amino acid-binding ACT domain protein